MFISNATERQPKLLTPVQSFLGIHEILLRAVAITSTPLSLQNTSCE